MKYKLRNNYSKNEVLALKEILKDRGVKNIENFLNPSEACELNPYDLDNIKDAAILLLKHLKQENRILFIIDADTDGYTSSSILWLYIKSIYPNANLSFSVHEHKQHGLNDKIEWIEAHPDYELVMMPDASSFDVKEHQILSDLGIDCIVLDHHNQLYDEAGNPIISIAPRTIVVNNQLSNNYKNKSLCGAGVAYKFCEVLDDILNIQQAKKYIDLAALGEIADVMDRTDTETNYIIIEGLRNIQNKGFQTLIESQSYSLKEKATYPYLNINAIDIAFYIAPLINALTRVGTIEEKRNLFYCFIEPDKLVPSTKRGAKAGDTETAAEQTARVGKNAKARQDKIKEKAIDTIEFKIQKDGLNENNIIIVEVMPEDNIPQEMSGLIAMGIVSRYNRPCLILRRNSNDELQGSARGNENFAALPSLKTFLEESGYFDYAAGHLNAFGAGLKASRMNDFINYANTVLNAEDFENCYIVDYILDSSEDNYNLLHVLAANPQYFGNHIDEIKVVVKNIPLNSIQVMGSNKDCIKISHNKIDYVKFKDLKFIDKILNNRLKKLNVLVSLNLNTYAGNTTLQGFIRDYELVDTNVDKYEF